MDARASLDRLTPIQRDVLGLFVPLATLVLIIAVTVGLGVDFRPGGGLAPWAMAVIFIAGLLFAVSVVAWYYVWQDERSPARGEFTREDGKGYGLRHGGGSFRQSTMQERALAEPHNRMEGERDYVPRTQRNWAAWVAGIAGALLAAGVLIAFSYRLQDPFALQMAAVTLVGAAIVFGAALVGDFSHSGPWTRRRTGP